MQISTEEFAILSGREVSAEKERMALAEQVKRLQAEIEILQNLVQKGNEKVGEVPAGKIMLDVDGLQKLLVSLDDYKEAAFLLLSIFKVSSGPITNEVFNRLLQSVFEKIPNGVNILNTGELNIDKLNNLGTLISVEKLAKLAV